MQQSNDEETLDELVAAARAAGFDVTADQVRRWHRAGLLPRPRQVGLGRPSRGVPDRRRGTIVIYPAGTTAQLLALCELRGQHKKLARLGWPLWWRGYDVAEHYVRNPLTQLVSSLAAIRDATDGLEISMLDVRQGLSARDAARRAKAQSKFASLAGRFMERREQRRLQKFFGISDARLFLKLWLLFLGGRLRARDLESVPLPVQFFPAPLELTQAYGREMVAQFSDAIRADVLGAALAGATLMDLCATRDELRKLATKFAPIALRIFDKAYPVASSKLAASSLDNLPAGTQHLALLGFLAHRGVIAIATATLGDIPAWLTEAIENE